MKTADQLLREATTRGIRVRSVVQPAKRKGVNNWLWGNPHTRDTYQR